MKKKGQNVAKNKKPVKKVVKKASAAKAPAKKASAKKAAPKKAVAKKAAPKAKKAAPKKAAPKKDVAKKAAPKKVAAKAPVKTKKIAPKQASAIKTTPAKSFVAKPTKSVDLSNFVTPLDDRVIIQPAALEKMTAGGLYIPDTVTDVAGNLQGTVVSVGRGHRNKKGQVRPMDLQVGDKVLFADYTGAKIKLQNHDLVIVREGDVLGVVG
jgi:chaperonin GroES